MKTAELITAVADATGLTHADAARAVYATFGTVAAKLTVGEAVRVDGFGSFETVERAPRTARHPKTGDAIAVPAKTAVKFRAATRLKDQVQD